jgi:hypothetical protein
MKLLPGVPNPSGPSFQSYLERINFCKNSSYHLPTHSLIFLMCKTQPLLSVGCGLGFTESYALKEGCDIICVDLYPNPKKNGYFSDEAKTYVDVIKMDAQEAVRKWPERNVFMAWPPYQSPMAEEVAHAMSPGRTLIYIGEDVGGCTADEGFFFYFRERIQRGLNRGRCY